MDLAHELLDSLLGESDGDPTHMHVIGSSGLGKSKFVEYLFREALCRPTGICLIDWSGSLYRGVLGFMAALQPHRDIFILNPGDAEYVTPYNPFADPGEDIGTTVNRRIAITVRAWGSSTTNHTPVIEEVSRILYHFAIAASETLPNAGLLLDYAHRELVGRFALGVLDSHEHATARNKLEGLLQTKSFAQWRTEVGSTDRRITRFLDPGVLRRTIGMPNPTLNVGDVAARNGVLIVNLSQTGQLDRDAARALAAFVLNDIFVAADRRRGTAQSCVLFLDEFQQYLSPDLADMLDQVRGGGVRAVLAHQHLGHLGEDIHLRKSVMGNCRLKVVFGGLDYEDAVTMAHEVRLPEINEREVLEVLRGQRVASHMILREPTHAVTVSESDAATAGETGSSQVTSQVSLAYTRQDDGAISPSTRMGQSTGNTTGHSQTESTTAARSRAETDGEAVLLVPQYEEYVAGYVERHREDRIGKWAAALKLQPQRVCTIQIKTAAAMQYRIPDIGRFDDDEQAQRAFEIATYERTGAIPIADAERLLNESRDKFFDRVRSFRKKRPSREHDALDSRSRPASD